MRRLLSPSGINTDPTAMRSASSIAHTASIRTDENRFAASFQ